MNDGKAGQSRRTGVASLLLVEAAFLALLAILATVADGGVALIVSALVLALSLLIIGIANLSERRKLARGKSVLVGAIAALAAWCGWSAGDWVTTAAELSSSTATIVHVLLLLAAVVVIGLSLRPLTRDAR
ncbi:hypothetical protein L1857_08415 [Amycolatopsis thermalba]|uniref:Uncharacterized protein n=1 Tax=Amycolatopsis thermalba TaxID=944492 RepID=A0ABY4NRZ9_9PSEU|nr:MULTISPECIES: hypothetical protein [Amycolatopsis]UQS22838.1 hypothetical protein L1857_08415 [Amycolatopsis thermalba]